MNWLRSLLGGGADGSPPPAGGGDEGTGLSLEQIGRKQRSEALLRAERVDINDWLPAIERVDEMAPRTPREVADRLLALTIVAMKGEGLDHQAAGGIVAERGIRALFSPRELTFLDDSSSSDHDRLQFVWRYEAAWVMFWALQLTTKPLGLPRGMCNPALLVTTVRDAEDLAANGLRSLSEIADEADLIYRCHWATRQAELKGAPSGGALDPGVAMERHKALNWLIGYEDSAEWDDVATDT